MQKPQPLVALGALRFAAMVRDGRALLDLSQADLAQRSGVSREAIARLEAGYGGMRVRDVERVLAALHAGGVALCQSGRLDLRDAPHWQTAR